MEDSQSDVITLDLDEDLIEVLTAEAEKRGISVDELMNEILSAIIAEEALKAREAGQIETDQEIISLGEHIYK